MSSGSFSFSPATGKSRNSFEFRDFLCLLSLKGEDLRRTVSHHSCPGKSGVIPPLLGGNTAFSQNAHMIPIIILRQKSRNSLKRPALRSVVKRAGTLRAPALSPTCFSTMLSLFSLAGLSFISVHISAAGLCRCLGRNWIPLTKRHKCPHTAHSSYKELMCSQSTSQAIP